MVNDSQYPANAFGLKSMNGNVWEWCADWYGEYKQGRQVDPVDSETGQYRVLRGGGWIDHPQDLRAAFRDSQRPDIRYVGIGLRLAGGFDQQASPERGAIVTADRGEGTESQRGGLARTARSMKR